MDHPLQLNRKYKNRIGTIIKIIDKLSESSFKGDDGLEYGQVGVALGKGSNFDLIIQAEDSIGKMLHALGISHCRNGEYTQPHRRYSPYPTSHRNYYQVDDCEDWNELVELGYAEKTVNGLGMTFYYVTDIGKKYLREIGYKWHDK